MQKRILTKSNCGGITLTTSQTKMAMKAYMYDGILESHKAREIAEDFNISETEATLEWFFGVIPDGEGSVRELPKFRRFVDKIDPEWDLYYDYGSDYYFAVKEK